jgi:hypothetical protein
MGRSPADSSRGAVDRRSEAKRRCAERSGDEHFHRTWTHRNGASVSALMLVTINCAIRAHGESAPLRLFFAFRVCNAAPFAKVPGP